MLTDKEFNSKAELGYSDNKAIPIEYIAGIQIKKFRSIENQLIELGSHVTVLSGRNGTMKTSIMGLIAHPFSSKSVDAFDQPLKTTLKEVFKLSPSFDQDRYEYNLLIKTPKTVLLREPVYMYWVGDHTNRHRVVVSGAEKGDGNFTYNTSFLNLKRLFPLVDTNAAPGAQHGVNLTASEAEDLKDFYESVFPSTQYDAFTPVRDKNIKTTFAPTGKNAYYDWEAISSGEDNLGAIFNRLVGFQRAFVKGQKLGNGIFCIDEFESSLHPVAQLRLFDYLFRWAQKHKVQIVISTHSLHLMLHIYRRHAPNLEGGRICINFLSKAQAKGKNIPVLRNPSYELAYKELTLEHPAQVADARKVKIFCEDDLAVHFAKRLIKSREVLKTVEFHSSLEPAPEKPGTSYSSLVTLCSQFPLLVEGNLVFFDADVTPDKLKKIRNHNCYLVLPDEENLALERRIVVFIASLENENEFFVKFGKEREAFLDEFKQAGIRSLSISDLKDESKTPIKLIKGWADYDKASFKKYVSHYCGIIGNREDFVKKFIERLNEMRASMGLPMVKI